MNKEQKQLIKKAEKIYGKIFPCINKTTLDECFTVAGNNSLILWFNTEDNSTHMVASENVAVYDVMTLDTVQRHRKGKHVDDE